MPAVAANWYSSSRLSCTESSPRSPRNSTPIKNARVFVDPRGGYTDEQLPSVQTIASKLNVLGFRLRTVVKSRPQKK